MTTDEIMEMVIGYSEMPLNESFLEIQSALTERDNRIKELEKLYGQSKFDLEIEKEEKALAIGRIKVLEEEVEIRDKVLKLLSSTLCAICIHKGKAKCMINNCIDGLIEYARNENHVTETNEVQNDC